MADHDGAPAGDETELDSKRLQLEQKRMFFNLKQNNRGKFLKVSRPWQLSPARAAP